MTTSRDDLARDEGCEDVARASDLREEVLREALPEVRPEARRNVLRSGEGFDRLGSQVKEHVS